MRFHYLRHFIIQHNILHGTHIINTKGIFLQSSGKCELAFLDTAFKKPGGVFERTRLFPIAMSSFKPYVRNKHNGAWALQQKNQHVMQLNVKLSYCLTTTLKWIIFPELHSLKCFIPYLNIQRASNPDSQIYSAV